jgi:hypothetical protein
MRPMKNVQKDWITKLTATTAVVAWALANGLDVVSMSLFVQAGGQLVFASQIMRQHPAEFVMLYAGMRVLGTLAVYLLVTFAQKQWPLLSQTLWSVLTACSLATAVAAWWRVL